MTDRPSPDFASRIARHRFAVLAAIIVVSGGAIFAGLRHTSTTFDEITLVAGGARGYWTGRFDLLFDHPPVMQYLYGLAAVTTGPTFPAEPDGANPRADPSYRWSYSRSFFWEVGNDPERLALVSRLVALAVALGLVLLVYAFTARAAGRTEDALLAALLTAFLPAVLAHGGIAYNDLPLAVALLGTVWLADETVRRPTAKGAAAVGLGVAVALGVKFSAAIVAPMIVLLVALEASTRLRDREWWRAVGRAAAVGAVVAYLGLVVVWRGDPSLEEFRAGMRATLFHVGKGHGNPAFLLGERSPTGWWYFFPVAFLFKTPAALHALLVAAAVPVVRSRPGLRTLAGSRLRAPAVLLLGYGAGLLTSNLAIGFRHALPALPALVILVAAGAGAVARTWAPRGRLVVGALAAWFVVSSLSWFPHFIPYMSEYVPDRDRGYEVLIDSSLDWGQGLLDLREFMEERGIERVHLGYFGSARPGGYGIAYEPLPSFFPLRGGESPPVSLPTGEDGPDWIAISATNLQGIYLQGDPYARFREIRPEAVLGHTIFLYRVSGEPGTGGP